MTDVREGTQAPTFAEVWNECDWRKLPAKDVAMRFWQACKQQAKAALAEKDAELARLTAELAAMTEDRNLWQEAHDDDCPNVVRAEKAEAELAALRASKSVEVPDEVKDAVGRLHHLATAAMNPSAQLILDSFVVCDFVRSLLPAPQESANA